MKYRPSRVFILCLAPMLLMGAGGAWAWNKANGMPLADRAGGDFFDLLKRERPAVDFDALGWPPPTPERREECRGMKERLLAEFPGLRIEASVVGEGENALLELHKLSGYPRGSGPKLSGDFEDAIHGRGAWDPDLARAALDAHADLVARAERIAAMEGRSVSGMPPDYDGFVSARAGKILADLLMLKARLAAGAGDEDEALRLVSAALNLAGHYLEPDSSNLLAASVGILIERSVVRTAFEHLLPAVGEGADLDRWRDALRTTPGSAARFAGLMRGEWNSVVEFMLAPVVLAQEPPDGDELMRIHAANFEALVTRLPGMSLRELLDGACGSLGEGFQHLSKESRGIAGTFFVGCRAWTKGYVRSERVRALHEAALEMLATGATGADPLTGEPFVFDPETRILSLPDGGSGAEGASVKLPW